LDNTLRLSDPSISRHHAVIRMGPSGYEIQDLQSSNGVLLNGNRVPSASLRDGDRITLGQMQLTFVDPPAETAGNPRGTVRMDPEAIAKLWAQPAPEAEPAAALEEAVPAEPSAPAMAQPGPAFLHPYLPSLPDSAIPLRSADGSPERGDFRTRFLAGLIDYSPMLVLSFLAMGFTFSTQPVLGCLLAVLHLALLVGYLILLPLYWMRLGATPGKKLMKLRVVPEADPAGRLDLNGAIMRLLGYLANGAISWIIMDLILRALPNAGPGPQVPRIMLQKLLSLGVGLLPYLVILGPGRQALEDKFSRSIVIKVDR
jgi:uncharacterized RDD family membrane protein YckC